MKTIGNTNAIKSGKKLFIVISASLIGLITLNTHYTQHVVGQSFSDTQVTIER